MVITSVTEFKNNLDKYLTLAETEDILISKNKKRTTNRPGLTTVSNSKKQKNKKKEMTQEEYIKELHELFGSINDPTFMVEPPEIPWEYQIPREEI